MTLKQSSLTRRSSKDTISQLCCFDIQIHRLIVLIPNCKQLAVKDVEFALVQSVKKKKSCYKNNSGWHEVMLSTNTVQDAKLIISNCFI